jgi:hypothetical protein
MKERDKMKEFKECKEFEHLLFLDDSEMTDEERRVVGEHVLACGECNARRNQFLGFRESMQVGVIGSVSEQEYQEMENNVFAEIHKTRKSRITPIRMVRWFSAVAATLLVMLFIGEQTYTIRKIARLENRLASIDYSGKTDLVDRWTILESREIFVRNFRAEYGKEITDKITGPFSFHPYYKSGEWLDKFREEGYMYKRIPQKINPFSHTAFIVKTK